MASARNDQSSSSKSININGASIIRENEQQIGNSRPQSVPQHLAGQRQLPRTSVPGEDSSVGGSNSVDYLGQRGTLQHQQSASSQHAIPPIPEDRSATVLAQHPSGDKQSEGSSPDPHSSAPTTGTTSTPTSLGTSSSPPCEGDAKSRAPPHYPGENLHHVSHSHTLSGAGPWQSSIPEGMIGPKYGSTGANPSERSEAAQFNVSPGEPGRYSSASFPSAIKLLVSNNVAGSIIGRAGQTISELQTQSATRIKLSQTGDYYPGSQDRVCLVQGQLENVKGALSLLLERLFMLQEQQHSQHLAWQSNRPEGSPPFDFVVRILVPSASCGMIIGKSGSNIRQMEEASGVASVRLSPKDVVDPNYPSATITSVTSERVVTLTGPSLDSCLSCLCIILDGMTAHPDICRYTNMTTSYSRIMADPFMPNPSPVRSMPPPESLHGPEGNPWEASHYGQPHHMGLAKRVASSPDLSTSFLSHSPSMPLEPRTAPVRHPSGRESLQYSPMFGDPSTSYSPLRPQQPPRMLQSAAPPMYLPTHMENQAAPAPVPSSVSAPDLLALHLESMHLESMHMPSSPQQPPPPPQAPSHQDFPPMFPSPQLAPAGPSQAGFTAQVSVPDNMIGSILGRGGRTLNELQAQSGTRIRISQRGEYLPGTRNRIVTIRGSTTQSVSLAQFLMSQRMILPRTATYQVPTGQTVPFSPPYSSDHHSGVGADSHIFHHAETQPPPSLQAPQSQRQPQPRGPPTGSAGPDHST